MKSMKKSMLFIVMLALALCLVCPSKVEAKMKWKAAYEKIIKKEYKENGSACRFKLIFFDKGNVPELVVGVNNESMNWVKMYSYKYKTGKVYTVMPQVFYAIGDPDPEYLPRRNYMRNSYSAYSGKMQWGRYSKIVKHKMVNVCNNGYVMATRIVDLNGNEKLDKGETLKNFTYYLNNKKISKKKYMSIAKKGKYKSMTPNKTYAAMAKILK